MAVRMFELQQINFKELISSFTIPTELLDDIIYCQRSLRQYIRAHQILIARPPDPLKPLRIAEIERDIVEIGREQKNLLINLRSVMDVYYGSLQNDKIKIDREIGNAHVSRLLSNHLEGSNFIKSPNTVKIRFTESQLFAKFALDDVKMERKSEKIEMINVTPSLSIGMNSKQVSLLKPKSERFALQKTRVNPYAYARKQSLKAAAFNEAQPTTRTINSSRLNLLEALNKARLTVKKPPVSPPASIDSNGKQSCEIISCESSTASDDSPTQSEEEAEVSQEMFLRKFGLYTLEYSHYLNQRRSKRRRRNVQSNEKSDYHYGKLALFEKMNKINKRKKTFLYSPPATRALKKKRADKDGEGTSKSSSIDRSSSSSPDQKIVCNECNKSDNLSKCGNCCSWFHAKCHKLIPLTKQTIKLREKNCPGCYAKLKQMKEENNSNESKDEKIENGLVEVIEIKTDDEEEVKLAIVKDEIKAEKEPQASTSDENQTKTD